MKKRVVALFLGMTMVLSALVGCGSQEVKKEEPQKEETKTSSEQEASVEKSDVKEEEVTLSFYSASSQANGSNSQWYWDAIKEKFGITFDIKTNSGDGDIMNALLAGGEMPDITVFGNAEDLKAAAAGGMLINLDEYKDQLPNIFENETYKVALDYVKTLTDGKQYGLPTVVGDNYGVEYDPQVRWDVYSKMGAPKAADWDAYLDVVKQMVEYYPETEDGMKTYGLGMFNDWDGSYIRNLTFYYVGPNGYTLDYHGGLVEVRSDLSEEPRSVLDDSSTYKAGLKYLFKANQMGLIDPDSTAQNYDGFNTKVANGQYMLVPFNWAGYGKTDVEDFHGYASLWPESAEVQSYGPYVTGETYKIGISSACENIDKALAFIDWYYSSEGIMFIQRGPEGELWEYDDNGKAVYTDKYLTAYKSGEAIIMEDGGDFGEAGMVFNASPVSSWTKDPATGQPYYISTMDRNTLTAQFVNYMSQDWREHFDGAIDMYTWVMENDPDRLTIKSNKLGFIPAPSDEMATLTAQIGNLVREASWKMVFAKDEAEFDSIWEQLKTDAEALGMKDVVADALARHAEGVATADALGIE